jgi:hypothetical protein
MFSPSLSTLTGSVVNRIDTWFEPSTVARVGYRLVASTLISAVGMFTCGTVECLVSGIQLILYLVPILVKQALRLLHLRSWAERLPELGGLTTLKILAHKTLALAVQILMGTVLIFSHPNKVANLYDALGLQRYKVSPWKREWNFWTRHISDAAQGVIALLGPLFNQCKVLVENYPRGSLFTATFVTTLGLFRLSRPVKGLPPIAILSPQQAVAELNDYMAAFSWSNVFSQQRVVLMGMLSAFLIFYREIKK